MAAAKPGGIAYIFGDTSIDRAKIVGVVSNIKDAALSEPAAQAICLGHEQLAARRMVVIIRTGVNGHSDSSHPP